MRLNEAIDRRALRTGIHSVEVRTRRLTEMAAAGTFADMESVFVYGTLRRGGSNHFRMDGAEFVAAGTVRGRLYHIDWYPGLVLDENAGEVPGEIHQVSAGMLDELDRFEGPQYRRVRVEVNGGGDHRSPLSAWLWEWLGPVDEGRRIISGDWLSHKK
ncbi:MAG: gamma-glutamylcyclotransferase [Verrucomicrobiaceae bacterium]|nr:MAG: gamma-glutamylcyclotransferase [Verrucomicrobiaceae bacterium]